MLDVLSGRAGALDTAGAWLQMGETAVTLGRDTLADEAAATALRRDPQSHGAPLLRAIIANRPGDHESALRTITELAAQVPASRHELTVILQFALAQLGVKRPEAALAALDTAWPRFTAGGLGGYTARDMVQELAALPLEFSPGTRWNYSVSTDVIGHLIELISGQRLDAYLREHVLQPLGMTDTSFVVTEEQSTRFAANYQRLADDSLKLIDHPVKSIYRDCAFFSGGGGLVATANDYSDGRRSSS